MKKQINQSQIIEASCDLTHEENDQILEKKDFHIKFQSLDLKRKSNQMSDNQELIQKEKVSWQNIN